MSRIFITGGTGYLGTNLVRALSGNHEVYFSHRNSPAPPEDSERALLLDIRSHDQVARAFEVAQPDCVVHTAALTRPDYCETMPEVTRDVNVTGTRHVLQECRRAGAKFIHISTDLVFDGEKGNYSEEDAASGINVYAQSKIEAEQLVLTEDPMAVVFRVSVMYGLSNPSHPGFLDEILGRWRQREPFGFFTDQYRSPTFAPQVADAVDRMLAKPDVAGIFHLGGAERLSRYEFATILARVVGAPQEFVKRASMHNFPARAKRGRDCSMVSKKIEDVLGLKPMRSMDGFQQLMQQGHLSRLQN